MEKTAQPMRTQRAKNPRSVSGFCEALDVGRTKFYVLLKDRTGLAPLTVLVGRRRLLRESPDEYLRRIAAGPGREAA